MDAGEEKMDLPAEAQPIEISVAAENTEVLMPENLTHAEVSPAAPSAENPATDATKPQQSAASGAGGISKVFCGKTKILYKFFIFSLTRFHAKTS